MIVLETNVTPPIVLYDETATAEEGGGLLSLIRPRVSGNLPLVGNVEYAPAGPPSPGVGGFVFGAILVAAGYGIISALRAITR